MKRIQTFKLFESGLRSADFRDISERISKLLTSDKFMPHTEQTSQWSGEERKFSIRTDCNQSKWGIIYDVSFRLDLPINLNVVNEPIKYSFLDVIDFLLDYYPESNITLSRFSYFNESVVGQKDGHTKQIEDVQDKAIEIIERLGESDILYQGNSPISFQIVVK